jgi:hypothetical protein
MAGRHSKPVREHVRCILVHRVLGGSAIFGAALPAVSTDIANFMGGCNTAWLSDRPTGNDFLPSTSDRKRF